jgi:hypothetical protein
MVVQGEKQQREKLFEQGRQKREKLLETPFEVPPLPADFWSRVMKKTRNE